VAVGQAELAEKQQQRDDQQRAREHVGQQHQPPVGLLAAPPEAGERVGAEDPDAEREAGGEQADLQAVHEEQPEIRQAEQADVVLQRPGGRQEGGRDAEHLGLRLQRGQRHPVEREGDERQQNQGEAVGAEQTDHRSASFRRKAK
jgi:hypothetical protein